MEFYKTPKTYGDSDEVTWHHICRYFKKDPWFNLGRDKYKKQSSVFDDHIYYVQNYIKNPFWVSTLNYANLVYEIFYIDIFFFDTIRKF